MKNPKRIFIDGSTHESSEMSVSEVGLNTEQVELLRSSLFQLESTYGDREAKFYVFNMKRENIRIDSYQPNKWVLVEKDKQRSQRIEVEIRDSQVLITANPMVLATGQNTVGLQNDVIRLLALPLTKLESWIQRASPEWCFSKEQRRSIQAGQVKLRRLAIAAYSKQFPAVLLENGESWDVARGLLALMHGLMGFVDVNVFGAIGGKNNSYVLDAFNAIGVKTTAYSGQLGMSGLRIVKTADRGTKQFALTPYMKLEELQFRGEVPAEDHADLVDRRIRFDLLLEEVKLQKFGITCAADLAEDTSLTLWHLMRSCVDELGVVYAVQSYGKEIPKPEDIVWYHPTYLTASGKNNKSNIRDASAYAEWYQGTLNKIPRIEVVRRIREITGVDVRFSQDVLANFRRVISDALMTSKARELTKQQYYARSMQDWEQYDKCSRELSLELRHKSKLEIPINQLKEIL